jgi:hypothetical protein
MRRTVLAVRWGERRCDAQCWPCDGGERRCDAQCWPCDGARVSVCSHAAPHVSACSLRPPPPLRRAQFVYTIPAFHNPTGATLSHDRKTALVALAARFNFLVLAGEPPDGGWGGVSQLHPPPPPSPSSPPRCSQTRCTSCWGLRVCPPRPRPCATTTPPATSSAWGPSLRYWRPPCEHIDMVTTRATTSSVVAPARAGRCFPQRQRRGPARSHDRVVGAAERTTPSPPRLQAAGLAADLPGG